MAAERQKASQCSASLDQVVVMDQSTRLNCSCRFSLADQAGREEERIALGLPGRAACKVERVPRRVLANRGWVCVVLEISYDGHP